MGGLDLRNYPSAYIFTCAELRDAAGIVTFHFYAVALLVD